MKKKLLPCTLLMVITHSVFCQTQKGTIQIGGSFGYSSSKQTMYGNKTTINQFIFNPQVGYFIVNNLSVILSANFYSEKVTGNVTDGTAKSYTIGPFLRYYFPAGEKLKLFAGGGIGFGSTTGILDYSSHSITAYQFEAGPAIFISQNVAVEMAFYYQSTKFKGSESFYDSDQSQFGISIALMLYLHPKKNK